MEKWGLDTEKVLRLCQINVVLPMRVDGNKNLLPKESHLQMFESAIADVFVNKVQEYLKQEFESTWPSSKHCPS